MTLHWPVPIGRTVLLASALLTGTCLLGAAQRDGSANAAALAQSRAAMIEPLLDD